MEPPERCSALASTPTVIAQGLSSRQTQKSEVLTFAGHPWGLSMAISGDFRVATDTIRARLGRARMVDEPSEVLRASSKVDCGVKRIRQKTA